MSPLLKSGLFWFLAMLGFACITRGAEFDHTHALFGQVLKRFVKDGRVDYTALKAAPQLLNSYLDRLAAVSPGDFKKWPEPQQLAFLINLYNATTLRLIIEHYPIKSIKKVGGLFSGPWDQEIVRLFGKPATLEHVEHEILRRNYREPRIHFALVCAAVGCPNLKAEPYVAARLDQQLDAQGTEFLGASQKNRVEIKTRTVYLSPIFKWFAEDFEAKSGSVLKFVQPYFPEEVRLELAKGGFRIRYTDYDWSLNDIASARR
jgi:hypothetical protein